VQGGKPAKEISIVQVFTSNVILKQAVLIGFIPTLGTQSAGGGKGFASHAYVVLVKAPVTPTIGVPGMIGMSVSTPAGTKKSPTNLIMTTTPKDVLLLMVMLFALHGGPGCAVAVEAANAIVIAAMAMARIRVDVFMGILLV
jgi:hypothetical protein